MRENAFDTLCWAKRLERAGYAREQAEELVGIVAKTCVFTDGKWVSDVEPRQLSAAVWALEEIEKASQ
mgnify:CR=1 FL=1